MKKNLYLVLLFVVFGLQAMAQLTEGTINYNMNFTSDDPDMAMAASMMQGSKMSIAFTPGKSRSEVSMGTFGKMSTIVSESEKKSLTLMDMMGMKYAMHSNLDDAKKNEGDVTIEKTSETKDIAGYTCTKCIMTVKTEEGEEGTITMWCTDKISATIKGQSYYNENIPGIALAMTMDQKGMKVEMTATSVDKKVDNKGFELTVPEGYEVKTEEEMKAFGQ